MKERNFINLKNYEKNFNAFKIKKRQTLSVFFKILILTNCRTHRLENEKGKFACLLFECVRKMENQGIEEFRKLINEINRRENRVEVIR